MVHSLQWIGSFIGSWVHDSIMKCQITHTWFVNPRIEERNSSTCAHAFVLRVLIDGTCTTWKSEPLDNGAYINSNMDCINNCLACEERLTARVICPRDIQIGPFGAYRKFFWKVNFHFIRRPHAAFLYSCMQRKGQFSVDLKWEWDHGVYDSGVPELDYFESMKPILPKWISTFLTSHMQNFPFPAYSEMGTPHCTPKVDESKGYMTLGHSNWTICSPGNLFLQNEFPLY